MEIEIQGRDDLFLGWGCGTSGQAKLGRTRFQSRAREAWTMEEASLAAAPSYPSQRCLRCIKHIKSLGGTGCAEKFKAPLVNEACQDMDLGGSVMMQQYMHDHCKAKTLGLGKNWHIHAGENKGNKELGFENLPDEVQTCLKELEIQVRKIRGENSELKRDISHLYTLVQVMNSEVRNKSSKITEQVVNLAEKRDSGCPCSINLDTKITALHSSVRIVESEIDGMRADIRKSFMEVRGGAEGKAVGAYGNQ